MKRAGNNQTLAAKMLGIGRNTLARKLKKYEG
jgi:DNA-binding protein Fis